MPNIYKSYLNIHPSASKVAGQFLRQQRINLDLSGEELALKMKLSQQQISRYERGVNNINLDMLIRFFSVLDMNDRDMLYFFELIISWHEETKLTQKITSS